MTSLIDVIFLLLLFFMLTSTFSRFSEVPLPLGGSGTVPANPDAPLQFMRVAQEEISLDGRSITLDTLVETVAADTERLIVSVRPNTTAQRLTDVLVTLRELPDVKLNVLVPS